MKGRARRRTRPDEPLDVTQFDSFHDSVMYEPLCETFCSIASLL
jgi:hypothetical protein